MGRSRKILLIITSIAVWLSGAQHSGAGSKQWKVSDNLTVSEISPGVWVHTSWRKLDNGVNFPANGLLVRNNNELTLIDTAWGLEITEELLGWIEAEIKLPVTRAVITHFHGDSMGGTAALAARGIPFVGHPLTRTLGAKEGVPLPAAIGDMKAGDAVTVANVEVFYPGPAHSRDNLVVWVPSAKVIFGSCAVRTPSFAGKGNTADADLASWPVAIGRVQERYRDVKIVVPGHGPHGDATLLSHTIGLFKE